MAAREAAQVLAYARIVCRELTKAVLPLSLNDLISSNVQPILSLCNIYLS